MNLKNQAEKIFASFLRYQISQNGGKIEIREADLFSDELTAYDLSISREADKYIFELKVKDKSAVDIALRN